MTGPDPHTLRRIRALATDYDRTLTSPDLELEPATVDALQEARDAGLKVIVISGRPLAFLKDALPHAVDAFVAENGCFVALPEEKEAVPVFEKAVEGREDLERAGIDVEWYDAMGSCRIDDAKHVREVLEGRDVELIANRNSLMILPRGVNKAVGLEAAIKTFDLSIDEVACAGDGENDIDMLHVAGHGIAVANALDHVKDAAEWVTTAPGGRGIVEWLAEWMDANGHTLEAGTRAQ